MDKPASSKKLLYIAIALVVVAAAVIAVYYTTLSNSSGVSVAITTNATGTIYPYQTTGLLINITNTGSAPLTNLPVVLYVNDNELHSYSISLAPHKSTQIAYAYNYTGPGGYNFVVAADPAMLVKLSDRSRGVSSTHVNVTAAAVPNEYTSIPNDGIAYTQSFSADAHGIAYASLFTKYYNVSFFNRLFGNKLNILPVIIGDLDTRIAVLNGAYVLYSNNDSAYVLWLQGSLTQQQTSAVVSTFSLRSYNKSMAGSRLSVFVIDNHTSVCVSSNFGWTTLVEYSNSSSGNACGSLAGPYIPTESNAIVNALKTANTMVDAAPNFIYSNSSPSLYSIVYSKNEFGIDNLFTNHYGLFLSSLSKNSLGTENGTRICYGLTSNSNGISTCSGYLASVSNASAQGFALVNTTSVIGNYTVSLYSLVNQSQAVDAHYAGTSLIQSLKLGNSTVRWQSGFNNTCTFHSNSIGCSVVSFNYSSQRVTLNITNTGANSIVLGGLACYIYHISAQMPFNVTLISGASTTVTVPCVSLSIPYLGVYNYYALNLTYNNQASKSMALNGSLQITNFVS